MVTEDLYNAVSYRYAPLALKELNFNLPLEDLKQQAFHDEENQPTAQDPASEAASNLQFIDRIKQRIAQFRDTHFTITTIIGMPLVWTPIIVQKFGDEVLLVGFSEAMRNYLIQSKVPNAERLRLGLQLIQVDGLDIPNALENMANYIAASSDDYRLRRAARALTIRNFSYPTTTESTWTFQDEQGQIFSLRLPWIYREAGNMRRDAVYYLRDLGVPSQAEFTRTMTAIIGPAPLIIDQGKAHEIAPLNFAVQEEFTLGGAKILRLGTWEKNAKTYAVAELKTFSDGKIKRSDDDSIEFDNINKALSEFVSASKAKKIPLILDLRQNNGGSPFLANELFSMFLAENTTVGSLSLAHRITRQVRQMLDAQNQDLINPDFSSRSIEAMKQAITANQEYTLPYEESQLSTHPDIGGFDQPLVVLIDSYCISACDRAAAYFVHYHVGKTLGTGSNGTGAGMTWLSDRSKYMWSDPFSIFESFFPNRLFGLPIDPDAAPAPFLAESNLENRPTVAEQQFSETQEHYLGTEPEDSWLDRAATIMEE